ncbi:MULTISPECIES: Maf family protein [unclassified Dehalobacter]|jgi:MAF protein|uniref:Maf family protein n=1 Tax=unclassified Dehalobacter TaxID=2635733 RepID=UPI00028BB332|nr:MULTISPECIES: Maf family protein [unclassified Dehalobacter]AFV03634.1 Septum formation protein Maf [Dehalobacter sp. DCA]
MMLILASASPRRRELLEEWGYDFRLVSAPVDEALPPGVWPEIGVQDLARRKALSGFEAWLDLSGSADDLILGADTIVVLDHIVLGKPADEEEAERMLLNLSGKTHRVMTAIALAAMDKARQQISVETAVEITTVSFRELKVQEIKDYIATGEPMDKAAAYGIQGGAAGFVTAVSGSWSNVVGLPMELLVRKLGDKGISPKK